MEDQGRICDRLTDRGWNLDVAPYRGPLGPHVPICSKTGISSFHTSLHTRPHTHIHTCLDTHHHTRHHTCLHPHFHASTLPVQDYNTRKLLERGFKSILHDSYAISVAPPKLYAARFFDFMSANVGVGMV